MGEIDLSTITIAKVFSIFLGGLLTALTPCVYPLIPIVVGYLGGREGSFAHRLFMGLSYALGLSIVYMMLGIVAGLSGELFGEATTNTYFYLGFGVFILYLGGSMMDWYTLPMPQFLQPRAGQSSRFGIFAPFIVGMSSGLVASPCTAPIMGSLLVYVASTRAAFVGGVLLFIFSIGMSLPLVIFAVVAGWGMSLPKSGMWMVWLKKLLAFVTMGAGIWFIYRAGQIS